MRPSPRAERRAGVGARLVTAVALLVAGAGAAAAENELRGFHVGMPVSELPAAGYTGFGCVAPAERTLAAWGEWRSCDPNPALAGRREIRFRFEDTANPLYALGDRYAGTKVGGQPMLLSLLIGDDGRVDGLRMRTDPAVPLFQRRRAFLFAEQVKARYGLEDWACESAAPSAEEEPIGGIFIREHCEKTDAERRFVLERWLYRRVGDDPRKFLSGSAVLILRRGAG